MSTYAPDPSMHTDPEIEKRCPYCHPKPAQGPPRPSGPMFFESLDRYANTSSGMAARAQAEAQMRAAYQQQIRNVALQKYPESEGNA